MASYRDVLTTPGVARIVAAQLAARFPAGMISLAFLMHVERQFDSYGAAGTVLAAFSIGWALAGPFTSRLMGRFGMRPVLAITTVLCAVPMVTIALAPLPLPLIIALALVVGASVPPVQSAVRTIYPKMVNSRMLTPLFSLDASAQEIIWILGPVVTTFVAIQISTTWAILLAAIVLVAGSAWFLSSPELGRVRIPAPRRRFGRVLANPSVLLSTLIGFTLLATCSAVETGVVASFGHGGPEAGFVLAIFAVGSFAAGLALGHRGIGPWSVALRLVPVIAGPALAVFSLDFWWLAPCVVITGIGIAPVLAALFSMTAASVRFSETAEAYGWVGTGQLVGAAMGSAVAGFTIDGVGPHGAFWAAAGFGLLGLAIAASCVRMLPDLRGRDASPIPDTEPVQTHQGQA